MRDVGIINVQVNNGPRTGRNYPARDLSMKFSELVSGIAAVRT